MRHITLAGDPESAGRTLGGIYKDTLERIIWGGTLSGLPGLGNSALSRNMLGYIHARLSDEYSHIEALADGAILDVTRLSDMFSLELGRAFGPVPPIISLMAAVPRADGERTDNGTPALGVIIDTVPVLFPMASLITRRPDRGHAWIELDFVPFSGAFFGINEKGLALALGLKPTEGDGEGVIPPSLSVRRALARCTNVRDAASLLMEAPRGASGFVSLADMHTAMILEFTPNAAEIRTPNIAAPIITAQHFLAPGMMARDIPHDETFPADAPAALRYRRMYESSERRFNAAHTILSTTPPPTGWDLMGLFSNEGSGLITNGPYYQTFTSAVLIPRRASIFLSTREDPGAYTRYGLNG
ncbi:MAG: hypothetical protein JW885_08160 [Deltaproteobacteria bacterium]|nr:hypothetical protein [Candidatus Zymogenaceae bacterium]